MVRRPTVAATGAIAQNTDCIVVLTRLEIIFMTTGTIRFEGRGRPGDGFGVACMAAFTGRTEGVIPGIIRAGVCEPHAQPAGGGVAIVALLVSDEMTAGFVVRVTGVA